MFILALTGGIACGKSTVAEMLRGLGASIIDADEISRFLTAPGGPALPAIREAFGDGVFHADGTLNRPALSAIVFGDEAAIARLNAITHPMIRLEMQSQLETCRKQGAQVVVLDVPLLFEAGMQDMGDVTACVTAPEDIQIARMKSRNGYDCEEAVRRIRSQMPVSEKAARSDLIIDTNLPLETLRKNVEQLYQGFIARKEHT